MLEKIADGAFGTVFLARDEGLGRNVALKLLRDPAKPSSSLVAEAGMLARVRHPNVVTVYGAQHSSGHTGIWMELVQGRTLEQLLIANGPYGAQEAAAIGITLCDALSAVHQASLVHGDIKTHNVCREEGGRIVLMDFGAGRDAALVESEDAPAGTPLYAAPERLHGAAATQQDDIYSLGVLLYRLVTADYPVRGATLAEIRSKHERGERTLLRDARSDLPSSFVAVVERAIAPARERRFPSAGAMRAALSDAPVAVAGQSAPSGCVIALRRWAATLSALVLTALVVFAVWTTRSSEPAADIAFQERDWVLVTAFENRTGNAQLDGILEHALTHELSTSTYVNVVPPERIDDALRLMTRPSSTVVDVATGREIALRDGATRALVGGWIERLGDGFAMTAQIIRPSDGATVASYREELSTQEGAVAESVRRVSSWARLTLGETRQQIAQGEPLQKATTHSLHALRLYSEGVAAAGAASIHAGKWPEAEALFASAVAADPMFASAHIFLAWTQWNQSQSASAIAGAARAVDLIDRATARERHFILGSHAFMTNRLDHAIGEFEALVRLYPDDYWGLNNLLWCYDMAGRHDAAFAMKRRLATVRPNDPLRRVWLAEDLLQLEGLAAARSHIAHAERLLQAAPEALYSVPIRTFVLLFPVFELWVQGRTTEAASTLEGLAQRPEIFGDGVGGQQILTSFYLSLGQLRRVEATWTTFPNLHPWIKTAQRASMALARGDSETVVRLLASYDGHDPGAVTLVIFAGAHETAGEVFKRLRSDHPYRRVLAEAELQATRGQPQQLLELVESQHPSGRQGAWVRSMMIAAQALATQGDRAKAIDVLETLAAQRDKIYSLGGHSGAPWMVAQKVLADLYRADGRLEDASRIEQDLQALLVVADDDVQLVKDLRERK